MARLTVERCKFDHFELVAIAAERAKQLISGAHPTVPKGNDKFSVVALREIEAGNIDSEKIKEIIIAKHQLHGNHDNIEEETTEFPLEAEGGDEYASNEHDFGGGFGDEEEFGNDNIFSDDIIDEEEK